MTNTIIGIFRDKTRADTAIKKLNEMGLDSKNMSIMVKDVSWVSEVVKNKGGRVAETTAGGAGAGMALGAITGILVGLGAITIPGIGALFIGGPIAAMLGLTGTAATAVAAATSGVLAGGVVGALIGLGLPPEIAEIYEERLKEGAIILAVPVTTTKELDAVESVFTSENAEDIHVFGNAPKIQSYPRMHAA